MAHTLPAHIGFGDFNAAPVITQRKKPAELGGALYEMVLACCDGKLTKAEALGFTETAVMRACNYV